MHRLLVVAGLAACLGARAGSAREAVADVRPVESRPGPGGIPDVRCGGRPDIGPRGFRHLTSRVVASLGRPDHRGHDLIVDAGAPQTVRGTLGYALTDKRLEDEDVVVFECEDRGWTQLGRARTDDDGHFTLELGPARLPIGMRELYAGVPGDGSGVRFLAYVAPRGTAVVVSDVDGTLTASELAYPKALFLGGGVRAQPGAPEALRAVAAAGYQVVYVTSRGDRFTGATQRWLDDHGFPRGPLRLASKLVTRPGAPTVAFKVGALRELAAFTLAAGIGNRASDVRAYASAGLSPARIWIKLPEFAGELDRGAATGFTTYAALPLPPGS